MISQCHRESVTVNARTEWPGALCWATNESESFGPPAPLARAGGPPGGRRPARRARAVMTRQPASEPLLWAAAGSGAADSESDSGARLGSLSDSDDADDSDSYFPSHCSGRY
jgi:hypothetical protein